MSLTPRPSQSKRTVFAILAACLLAAGAFFLPDILARRAVEAALARLPGSVLSSVGEARYRLPSNTLSLRDVRMVSGRSEVQVREVVLVSPSRAAFEALARGEAGEAPTRLLAERLDLTGLRVVEAGGRSASVDSLRIERPAARAPLMAATDFFDRPMRWNALAAIIAALDAERVELSGYKLDAPGETALRVNGATLARLHSGKAESAAFSAILWDDLAGDPASTLKAGSLRLESVDLAALDGLVNAERYDGSRRDPTLRRLVEKLEADGLDARDPDSALVVKRLTLQGLSMRQLSFLPVAIRQDDVAGQALARIVEASRVERFEVDGLDLSDGAGARLAGFEAAGFDELGGSGEVRFARIWGRGYVAGNEQSGVKLSEIEVQGVDLSRYFARLAQSPEPPAQPLGLLRFESLAFRGMEAISPEAGKSRLDELRLKTSGHLDLMPAKFDLRLNGLEVTARDIEDAETRRTLEELGFPVVKLNLGLAYDWDSETKRLDPALLSIGADGMGEVSLTARIGGLDLSPLAAGKSVTPDFDALTLERLELAYRDHSLANRVLTRQAADAGLGVDAYRTRIIQDLGREKARLRGNQLATQALDSLSAFLAKPVGLTLTAEPKRAVSFRELLAMGMQKPEALIGALNLKVRAD